jgi:hypothetical protein
MKAFIIIYVNHLLFLFVALCIGQLSFAQCNNAPTLKFHSPVLISGVDGQVGAVYNFPGVAPGLDAHIAITGLYGGATVYNIDDSAGVGYYDAFQPYVGAGANDTSYVDWHITFKKSGTNTDTMLACLAVTGVDVDGDGSSLKEFIEAATPGSFSVDPFTNLSVSFDGVRSKAISPVANIPLIDTNHLEAMFQMNFTNITSLDYRNGAITNGAAQIRQTCIYFKPFFQSYFLLPTTLLSFTARPLEQTVELKWSATDEGDLKNYTLQRSEDGKSWMSIGHIPVLSSSLVNNYLVNDFSDFKNVTYYRLMEVLKNGTSRYSEIVKISPKDQASDRTFSNNTLFSNSIRMQSATSKSEELGMSVYSLSGSMVANRKSIMHTGINTTVIDLPSSLKPGVYFLVVKDSNSQEIYHSKIVKIN